MSRRLGKIIIIGLVFLSAGSALGMASGFGVYGAYDILIGTVGWYDNSSGFERIKIVQAGILFDTCMAKDRLFNYRLQVGLDFSTASYFDSDLGYTVSMDVWQLIFINSFGFGLIREEGVRFWVGPQVGISFGFEPSFSQSSYYSVMSNFFEYDIFAGLVIGLNLNLGEMISLCADIGLRLHEDIMVSPAAFFYGFLIKPFADVGLVFRIEDRYED